MDSADLSPATVVARNQALCVLRNQVNNIASVNADTYRTKRPRQTGPEPLILMVDRFRVHVSLSGNAEQEWVYLADQIAIGTSADPVDAAVRLVCLLATAPESTVNTASTQNNNEGPG